MLGKMSISKGCPVYTLGFTRRSLWSPQQVTQDNCPKGMSLQHCPCRIPGSCCIPSPCFQGKGAATWFAGTHWRVFEVQRAASLQRFHIPAGAKALSPCDPSLGQSIMEHEGNGAGKQGEGKKQFSTQFSNFLKEESDL